jgi:hypothetical protein
MPCRLPLGVSVAVLKSAWASSHRQVAAGRQRRRVEVGVGVEPQHAQLPAGGAAMRDDRPDRADRDRVVAAEQDRQPAGGEFRRHRRVDEAVPGHHFRQVAVAADRGQHRIQRAGEIARVAQVGDETGQRLGDAGHAQRLGTHVGAADAGADVGRRADEGHGARIHGGKHTLGTPAGLK